MSFFRCTHTDPAVVPAAARARRGPLVVDFHCHMIVETAERLAQAHKPALPEPAQRFASPETRATSGAMNAAIHTQIRTTGLRLQDMDAAGIDIQVISPSPGHYCYWAEEDLGRELARLVNDALAETAAQHPGRIQVLGTVPMQSPTAAVDELRRCVRDLGMRGVELCTNVGGLELADERFHPFFAEAQALGAVLFLHPSGFTQGDRLAAKHLNNIIGNPLDTTVALSHLIYGGVLDRLPGLKLCVAHGGGMMAAYPGRFDHAWHARSECQAGCQHAPSHYLRRMYFDSIVHDPMQLKALVERWGATQVLLGTDYPYDMCEPDPVGFVHAAGLGDAQTAQVLGANAARLLGLDPARLLRAARG